MAKRFAAGLVQGVLVCGVAVAALSLALPQPPRPALTASDGGGKAAPLPTAPIATELPPPTIPKPDAEPASAEPPPPAPIPEPAPSVSAPEPAAQVIEPPEAESRVAPPAVQALPLPTGSDVTAATDQAPSAPAGLGQTPARPAPAAPASAPAPEATPAPTDTGSARPEAVNAAPAVPAIMPQMALPEVAPIDLPAPAGEAPIPVPPPGKVVVPGLDRAPERQHEAQPQQATLTRRDTAEQASQPKVQAETPTGVQAETNTAPARRAPDLSLPPDLGGLGLAK